VNGESRIRIGTDADLERDFGASKVVIGFPVSTRDGLEREIDQVLHVAAPTRSDIWRARLDAWVERLFRAWLVSLAVLTVIALVLRIVTGPLHGALLDSWVLLLVAPLIVMLLWLVAGWLWFALMVIAWPVKRVVRARTPKGER